MGNSRLWAGLVKKRAWVQFISTLLVNNGLTQQMTKGLPCIGFNCYACPLAAAACPIGSLQHFVSIRQVPWYILGVVILVGALSGRLACGWLCPFGWIQEMLYKIPVCKWAVQPRKRAAWWKLLIATGFYGIGLWSLLPLAVKAPACFALYLIAGLGLYAFLGASRAFALGGLVVIVAWITGEPWFCKVCPAGTLEGGIPQVLLDANLRGLIGALFWLKIAVLAFFLAWMAVTRRPFCRWLCPLGALWSLLNRWSTLQIAVDIQACIRCDCCRQVCPVDIRIYQDANSGACIRCLQCIDSCPVSCIGVKLR